MFRSWFPRCPLQVLRVFLLLPQVSYPVTSSDSIDKLFMISHEIRFYADVATSFLYLILKNSTPQEKFSSLFRVRRHFPQKERKYYGRMKPLCLCHCLYFYLWASEFWCFFYRKSGAECFACMSILTRCYFYRNFYLSIKFGCWISIEKKQPLTDKNLHGTPNNSLKYFF